jgi:hypothetical protein
LERTATSGFEGASSLSLATCFGLGGRPSELHGNGKYGQPVDLGRIMVRVWVRGQLEALKVRFPDLLGGCEILDSGGTDYAYWLFLAKPAWTEVSHLSLA